jgi:uncharacterized protein (TIGR03435 family)
MLISFVLKSVDYDEGWNMMRLYAALSVLALLSGAAFGQSTEAAPKFEVADVHGSPMTAQPFARGPFYSSGRYELRFATMLDLVRTAYGVDPEKVLGGPSWLEMDRFDVFATTPAGSTAESRKLMLQALLADRFKLVVHNDSKPMAAYALIAGKRPQLKEADGSGETGCKFTVQNIPPPPPSGGSPAPAGPIELPVIVYTCHNTTMAAFADGMLSLAGAGQYFSNKLVVDQTGLKGAWDFNFKFTPKIPAGIAATGENITIFDAVDKQLGLKLEPSTVPMPVIVVDSVNQKPTDNSPDVAKSFPPLPTEFDVAEIKPAAPSTDGDRGGAQPEIKNGRIYLPGITLKNLIMVAWDLNGDEKLAGAPKWLDADRFDVIAKAPAGVAIGDLTPQRSSVPLNIDALRPMIRALVVDRFKLVVHTEDRPLAAYTLTAIKPKLKKADPTSRTKWQNGAATESKDNKNANAALGRLVTCQNVTMAQFAKMLPVIAPGYIRTEVADATGLEGGWDFTFSFSPAGVLQLGAGQTGDASAQTAGGAPEASTPNGALSLFDALTRELGLKLEMQKRPMPILVIDHVEPKPTDN